MRHMLDSCNEILEFMEGRSLSDLEKDRKLALSVVHLLEIIGEAASGVSDEVREKDASIPWSSIIGMRNRLIHGYFDIDLEIVWKTVEKDIPTLKGNLEKIIDE